MDIGFSEINGVIMEGNQNGLGKSIEPRPFCSPAVIGTTKDVQLFSKLPNSVHVNQWGMVFREDFFDTSGRIKRGRFYSVSDSNPMSWIIGMNSGAVAPFQTFNSLSLSKFPTRRLSDLRVFLGTVDMFSEWRVTSLEYINTTEILVTLKSKSSGNLLPDIDLIAIPSHRDQISEIFEKLLNEIQRGLPESVIELCRNLASIILTAKNFEFDSSRSPKDLAEEAKFFLEMCNQQKIISFFTIPHCANLIARFHAEGKAVERLKSGCHPLTDRDAELAVNCISRIITTLGWGSYS